MGKWFKRIVIAGVVLVVLLIAAIILIPVLFKDRIEALVKEQVNATLNATVEWGEWDITLLRSFPDLTVEVAGVKLCNKAPFEGVCLADIGSLTATVDIKSVFGDKVDIKRIGLVRPRIHAVVRADGKANWDITLPDSSATEAPADTGGGFSIGLREYWIEDGRVVYDDSTLAFRMDLLGLDHKGTGDFTQDLFTLSTTTHVDTVDVLFDGVRYLQRAVADITADLDMDMAGMKFTFKENEAVINRLTLGFDGWLAMPADDIDMDITWALKKNELGALLSMVPAAFAKDLEGVDMSGKAAFAGYVKGTYNDSTMPGFGLDIAVENGRFKYPDLPESVERIQVKASIVSPQGKDLDGMVIDVPVFAMQVATNPVNARLHLERPMSDPRVDLAAQAKLDLASLKRVVPLEKGDELNGKLDVDVKVKGAVSDIEAQRFEKFTAEGRVLLSGMTYRSDSLPWPVGITTLDLALSPRYLALNGFDGTLGGSDVRAKGRFDSYLLWWLKDSTLTGTFDVASRRFDLNELMGPEEPAAAESAPADTAAMTVIEVPANINFRLSAEAGEVIYDDLTLTGLKGGVHIHDRRVDLNKLVFGLFEGRVGLDGSYATPEKGTPVAELRYDIRDMDIEKTVQYVETVQKLAPIAKTCKGKYSTTLSLRTELDAAMSPVMESLTGQGTLSTRNVRVDGFQPLVDLAKAFKVKGIDNTTLPSVDFSYEFRDGKMITKPFDVKIDRIKANVGGSTAFADQAIDYDLKAKVPTDMFGAQANQLVAGWLGQANQVLGSGFQMPAEIEVTAKITGTIDKPVVKPVFAGGGSNLKETIVTEVKQELNQQIDKAKEEAIARAREEAAKLLAEAQKQADNLKATARREAANIKGQAYKAADDELAKVTNPLAKMAAKAVADAAKKEADKQEQKAIAEADRKADGIVAEARKQGDALIAKAEQTNTTIK